MRSATVFVLLAVLPSIGFAKAAPTKAASTKAASTKASPTKAAPTKAAPTKAAPTKAAPTKAAPTKASSLKATLACTTGAGEQLSGKGLPRLADPVTCTVSVETDGKLKATVVAKSEGKTGPAHSGEVTKGQLLKIQLVPGKDFASCVDFEIDAQIDGDSRATPWTKQLAVKQDCKIKKIKASLDCLMERGGKNTQLPARGNPRLEGPISCRLVTTDSAALSAKVVLRVSLGDKPVSVSSGRAGADNGKYIFGFELAPDVDFSVCSEPITLTGEILDDNGDASFQKSLTLTQSCPD